MPAAASPVPFPTPPTPSANRHTFTTTNDTDASADASAPVPAMTPQQQAQLAALQRFRPSTRDVISGIAPHVFDDTARERTGFGNRRRPSSRGRARRAPSPDCRYTPTRRASRSSSSPSPGRGTCRSPLRRAVMSVDENGAVIQLRAEEDPRTTNVRLGLGLYTSPGNPFPTPAHGPYLKAAAQPLGRRRSRTRSTPALVSAPKAKPIWTGPPGRPLAMPVAPPPPKTEKEKEKEKRGGFRDRVFKTLGLRPKC